MNPTNSIIYFGVFVFLVFACAKKQESKSRTNAEFVNTLYENSDSVYIQVDEMPRFPGCEDEEEGRRKACSDKKMLSYIYKNLRLETSNKNGDLEYKIVVSFVLRKDGDISDIEVIRGMKTAKKTNLIDLLDQMPKWIPGKKNGELVNVRFSLPLGLHYE